jgi:hypothetical protein
MEAAMATGQPISEIRALSASDLRTLLDVVQARNDGR